MGSSSRDPRRGHRLRPGLAAQRDLGVVHHRSRRVPLAADQTTGPHQLGHELGPQLVRDAGVGRSPLPAGHDDVVCVGGALELVIRRVSGQGAPAGGVRDGNSDPPVETVPRPAPLEQKGRLPSMWSVIPAVLDGGDCSWLLLRRCSRAARLRVGDTLRLRSLSPRADQEGCHVEETPLA